MPSLADPSHPASPVTADAVGTVQAALARLRGRMLDLAEARRGLIDRAATAPRRRSAENLVHYIALREGDHRPLQKRLVALGLSSLGRAEPSVLGTLEAALHAAGRLRDPPEHHGPRTAGALTLDEGRGLLDEQTDALFGPRPSGRAVRVMVTMPAEAAVDRGFIAACLERGMNVMRINTAHDTPADWLSMLDHLEAACATTGLRCRVFADLPGPKIRTTAVYRRGRARESVRVAAGDELVLLADGATDPCLPADAPGRIVRFAPEPALAALEPGQAVWFDDGKAGAVVTARRREDWTLRITHAKPGGQRLRPGRGVNAPDTMIDLPALTDRDFEVIATLSDRVDALGLSFVRCVEDVRALRRALAARGGRTPALVLKIETRAGFDRLPELLLELLTLPVGGVMLARGDLAIECGFERMAEIQEELLAFCEAAHTPVIWATEVLSSLAKTGRPTRAEITDAAMAQRAECVMLNKGPEILAALTSLDDILVRMQSHQRKKMATFRPLRIATLPAEPPR